MTWAERTSRTVRSVLSLNRHAEVAALLDLLDLDGHQRVLDVGSGDGYWTVRMGERAGEVVGIDPSDEVLRLARRLHPRFNVQYDKGSAEELPYPAESFDRVISVSSVEHFDDPGVALKEMARVLRVGGVLAISVDSLLQENSSAAFRRWHSKKYFVNTYFTDESLVELLRESGLEPEGPSGLFDSGVSAALRALYLRRKRLLVPIYPAFLAACYVADRWSLGGSAPPQVLIVRARKSRATPPD